MTTKQRARYAIIQNRTVIEASDLVESTANGLNRTETRRITGPNRANLPEGQLFQIVYGPGISSDGRFDLIEAVINAEVLA